MKFYKRVLKLHQFRNLGRNLPTELLLNSSFEKHGGLVILVGENNVGKSNILEALKAFNDTGIKLCNENDYFKAHEFEDAVLSLEEETSLNNETIDFSCVDLKIQTKEIGEGLKELSKTLIVYPFEKHVESLREQCSKIVFIPSNNNDYSNICTFVSNFKNLIDSYNQLKPFLRFYKEKVKHPTAKAIGLPRLMLPVGRVWFSLCVPNHRDFTEFELQRIPYRSHTSYLQRRNFAHFLR